MLPTHRGMSHPRLSVLLALGLLLLGTAGPVSAQTSSTTELGVFGLNRLSYLLPSLVYRPIDDVGVRPGGAAMGMGGAYIAQATGPMAVGWNPAGVAAIRRTAIAVDGVTLKSNTTVGSVPDTMNVGNLGKLLVTTYRADLKNSTRANLIAAATPLWERGNFRVSGALSWRRYYEISLPEEFVQNMIASLTETGFPITASKDRREQGAVQSFAPTLAAQISSGISLGINFNFLTGRLHSSSNTSLSYGGFPIGVTQNISFLYTGFVPDLGARWEGLGNRLTVAARYTPAFTLQVRGGGYSQTAVAVQTVNLGAVAGKEADYDLEVPFSYAAGVACRPTDRLLLAFDLTSHKWSQAKVKYVETPTWPGIDGPDNVALSTGLPLEDVTTVHAGIEYVLLRRPWGELPVRFGFHTAPQSVADLSRSDFADSTYTPYGAYPDFHHTGIYHGSQIDGKAFSFGASLRLQEISYDLGVELTSYDRTSFLFDKTPSPYQGQAVDDPFNPAGVTVKGQRKVTRVSLSSTYNF